MEDRDWTPAWEQMAEVGSLTAFFRTIIEVVGSPSSFFTRLSPQGPVRRVIGFWAATALPPLVVAGISANALIHDLITVTLNAPQPVQWRIPWWVLTVAAPLMQFMSLLFGLAVVHLVLQMLGEDRGGWSGTFRGAGYATAPGVFGLVPVVGAPVAGLWVAILQFMALRRVHRTGFGMLLLAYLLPVVAATIIGIGLALILVALLAPEVAASLF
jgi:hypothetical protein